MSVPAPRSPRTIFFLGSTAGFGANALSQVIGIVSVPLGLRYFGASRYGIWVVISSVVGYLSLSQLGIAAAAQTLIAKASSPDQQRSLFQRSLFLGTLGALVAVAALLVVRYSVPGWVNILGRLPLSTHAEAEGAAWATALLFLLQVPTNVFGVAFAALLEIHWERFYLALGKVAALAALVTTILLQGDLRTLALLTGAASLGVGVASGIHLFLVHPAMRFTLRGSSCQTASSQSVLASGVRFLAISIAAMAVWNSNSLIISHYLGLADVAQYSVYFRLFCVGFSLLILVNGVLWPMYGAAAGANNWAWVQRTYGRTVHLLAILGGLLWVGGISFAPQIVSLWAGSGFRGGLLLPFALGGYGYSLSLVCSHTTVLNALNATWGMVAFAFAEALANVCFTVAFIRLMGIGGVALGMLLGAVTTVFWISPLYLDFRTAGRVQFQMRHIVIHGFLALLPALALACWLAAFGPSGSAGIILRLGLILLYLGASWYTTSSDLRSFVLGMLHRLIDNRRVMTR